MNAVSIERAPERLVTVTDPQGQFRRNYNRANFMFKHELTGNPLFEIPSLVELTRRMPDHGEHYWSNGPVAVNNTWSDGTIGRQSLQDTIINIEHNNSIVILKHTEQDPVFAPVLQSVLATMIELSGEHMRSDVTIGEVLILVSSPGRITPYHMDSETNFLLQVTGDKWFHIFDHTDRTLVTEREREDFFAISRNCAVYRPERQDECNKYDLHAGYGVHVPPCAPHWVQNRDNVSVALSVNYELRSIDRLEKLHRFNRRLRKLGLHPATPRASDWRDRIKLAAEDGVAVVRSMAKRRPAPPPYQVWTPPAH
jgi:mannose-6-phosphate isomerase-like protein (cupin superfamily)